MRTTYRTNKWQASFKLGKTRKYCCGLQKYAIQNNDLPPSLLPQAIQTLPFAHCIACDSDLHLCLIRFKINFITLKHDDYETISKHPNFH